MSFIKKFAFGTICSSSALMAYGYYYPLNFYENCKFINKILFKPMEKKHNLPPRPY